MMIPNVETLRLIKARTENQEAELRRYLMREWNVSRTRVIYPEKRKKGSYRLRAAVRSIASMIF